MSEKCKFTTGLPLRVESLGSYWFIDFAKMEYHRTPKQERPREKAEWGGPEAGPLQDLVGHPFTSLELIENEPGLRFWKTYAALRIHVPGTKRMTPLGYGSFVHAPISKDEFDRLKEVLADV